MLGREALVLLAKLSQSMAENWTTNFAHTGWDKQLN